MQPILIENAQNVKFPGKNTSDLTKMLTEHLRRGNGWMFAQAIGDGKRTTHWIEPGKPFVFPASWTGKYNVYFGVNPASTPILDIDRQNYPGKTDAQIMRFVASKNRSICAVNALIAEFDGKDFTQPTPAEIATALDDVREDAEMRHLSGELTRMLPEKVLLRMAYTKAQNDKYATDPERFKSLALAHVNSLAMRPSALVNSGGGVQGYWLLDEPFIIDTEEAREYAKGAQKRFTAWAGGDQSVKDLRRVLRLPGTLNVKAKYAPNYPTVDFAWFEPERLYAIDELISVCPEPPAPVKRTARQQRQAASVQAREYSADDDVWLDGYEWAVAQAFNASHSMTETLLNYGYTKHGERMSRPGEPESRGVIVDGDDKSSFHFSGNDALYSDHVRRPFDVVVIYDFDGDCSAATAEFGPQMGIVDPQWIDVAKEYILTQDIGRHVPADQKAQIKRENENGELEVYDTQYRTRSTDMLVLTRILEIMERVGRANDVAINTYEVIRSKNSDGKDSQLVSRKALGRVLPRHAWLFDAKPASKPGNWNVSLKNDFLKSGQVSNNDYSVAPAETIEILLSPEETQQQLKDVVITCPLSDQEVTESGQVITTVKMSSPKSLVGDFAHWKADDQFSSGTSRFVRQTVRRECMDGCADDINHILDLLPRGLQSTGILVVDALVNAGGSGATVSEIATEFGLNKSSVNAIVRKLRNLGLVESKRFFGAPSIHWIAPDAFEQLHSRRHEFRTYKAGACRLERTLEHAQNNVERQIELSKATGEDTAQLERKRTRLAEQRRPLLLDIYPGMTDDEATKWLYTPKLFLTEKVVTAPEMPEPSALAWYRLCDLMGKERLTADEYGEVQQLQKTLKGAKFGTFQGVVDF